MTFSQNNRNLLLDIGILSSVSHLYIYLFRDEGPDRKLRSGASPFATKKILILRSKFSRESFLPIGHLPATAIIPAVPEM